MMSISPDARKVQKSCFFANVNVDGKQLKQIKKKVFNSPFRKGGIGMWPMKNGAKMKKKTWSGKSVKRKWRLFFNTAMILMVKQVDFLCLFHP